MRAVIDAYRSELPKDVLAQETVKLCANALREVAEIHNRDRLGEEKAARDFKVRTQAQGVANNAGTLARQLHVRGLHIAVQFGADNRVIGAGIEQECGPIPVDLGVYQNQGMHGAKGQKHRPIMRTA